MAKKPEKTVEDVARERRTFHPGAYHFILEGLQYTLKKLRAAKADSSRSVSGKDLCHGLRNLAVSKWGGLAGTVLARWNVRSTEDFGKMVFDLVENDLMRRNEEDQIEDFEGVFDFSEVFDRYDVTVESLA